RRPTRERAHRAREAAYPVGRDTLAAQRGEPRSRERRLPLRAGARAQQVGGCFFADMFAREQMPAGLAQVHCLPPVLVRKSPMISFSGVRAVTSRSAGKVSAFAISE